MTFLLPTNEPDAFCLVTLMASLYILLLVALRVPQFIMCYFSSLVYSSSDHCVCRLASAIHACHGMCQCYVFFLLLPVRFMEGNGSTLLPTEQPFFPFFRRDVGVLSIPSASSSIIFATPSHLQRPSSSPSIPVPR